MRFENRTKAAKQLADILFKKYKGKDVVVYGLPRGGVIVAVEVAKKLQSPLDLVITRKIGHPYQSEYAIAAVTENGSFVGNEKELKNIQKLWFKKQIKKERKEAKRRRTLYMKGRTQPLVKGKIAIIVDDGIATGLTIKAAIREINQKHPKKIVVAVPVAAKDTVEELKKEADEVIVLHAPSDFYAIGAYYDNFEQVSDEEVIQILTKLQIS